MAVIGWLFAVAYHFMDYTPDTSSWIIEHSEINPTDVPGYWTHDYDIEPMQDLHIVQPKFIQVD